MTIKRKSAMDNQTTAAVESQTIPAQQTQTPSKQKTHVAPATSGKKNNIIIGILATLCVVAPAATYFALKSDTVSNETVKTAVGEFGEVQEQHTIGSMTANVIKTPNGQAIVYSTSDGQNLIMGDVYDLDGKPVFDELIKKLYASSGAQPEAAAVGTSYGQALGEFTGELPEAFNYLESLGGFKEDPSVSPANTIYVVYDPRCPYCHEFFRKSRTIDLKAKGLTIKWLPTTALGSAEPGSKGEKLAAQGLHIKDMAELENTFGRNSVEPDIEVTDEDRNKLNENFSFLLGSVEELQGPGAPKVVPTAFFLNKQNGAPTLIAGPNEDIAFKTIFGE